MNPWVLLIAGSLLVGAYVKGCSDEKARSDAFVASVQAVGQAQEALTRGRVLADKQAKEKADADHKTHLAALHNTVKRLRDQRTSGGFLPAPSPDSPSPDRATFERAELVRALQQFDGEVAGLTQEGDEARLALDAAKKWAQGLADHNSPRR